MSTQEGQTWNGEDKGARLDKGTVFDSLLRFPATFSARCLSGSLQLFLPSLKRSGVTTRALKGAKSRRRIKGAKERLIGLA